MEGQTARNPRLLHICGSPWKSMIADTWHNLCPGASQSPPDYRQKLKGSFYRGYFSQRGASSYWRPWKEGFGVGFRGGVGGGFPVEKKGKGEVGGEGGGGGVGTGKGSSKSMRKLCRNYPLAIYPLVSTR